MRCVKRTKDFVNFVRKVKLKLQDITWEYNTFVDNQVLGAEQLNEIITELAVIQVEPFGFALREVAPGVSSDDVRHRVDASLHVADDLKVMEW